jgi:hypothetical protein
MSDAPALVRRYYDEVLSGGRLTVGAIHIHRERLAELWEEIDLLGLQRQLGALGG